STFVLPASLGPRVRPFVHRSQSVTSHVSVDLRGPDIGVSQQLLDGPEVGATLEEMGRERMPQGVRMEDASVRERHAGEHATHVSGRHPAPAAIEKQRIGAGCIAALVARGPERFELGTGMTDVGSDCVTGGVTKWDTSYLCSLSEHGDRLPSRVDI